MDTSNIPVVGGDFAAAEVLAVQRGARVVSELLRLPPPRRVHLLPELPMIRSGGGDGQDEQVGLCTEDEIALSRRAALTRSTEASAPHARLDTLAFCSGFETARFLARHAPWSQLNEAGFLRHASWLASVASGFRLVALGDGRGDPLADVVGFFCRRLDAIREMEGQGALWRGALGLSVRDLTREVGFSGLSGRTSSAGHRLRGMSDILPLLDYFAGRHTWPFPPDGEIN
jgi:hypothetical protein